MRGCRRHRARVDGCARPEKKSKCQQGYCQGAHPPILSADARPDQDADLRPFGMILCGTLTIGQRPTTPHLTASSGGACRLRWISRFRFAESLIMDLLRAPVVTLPGTVAASPVVPDPSAPEEWEVFRVVPLHPEAEFSNTESSAMRCQADMSPVELARRRSRPRLHVPAAGGNNAKVPSEALKLATIDSWSVGL